MSKPVNVHDATGTLIEVPGVGILMLYGTTVPTATTAGYATGCLFIHTDGGDNTALYVNEGTKASCTFNAVSAA